MQENGTEKKHFIDSLYNKGMMDFDNYKLAKTLKRMHTTSKSTLNPKE